MTSPNRTWRVAFVSTMNGTPWGGSEQLWSETALELRRRGHAVAANVLRWPRRAAPLQQLAREGAAVAFRPRRRRHVGRLIQKCLLRVSPGTLDVPERLWLRRCAADLVVVSQGGPWDGVPWMLACRARRIPYCAIVQANSELWWPLDERLDGICSALAGAERIFFVADANRRLMELQCGQALANAEVIANPCKVDRAFSEPWPAEENSFRFACVGRLSPAAKGHDVLLQVLAQPKWRKRPIQLHLYGEGPSEQAIRALVRFLGLTNVFFHGQVANVREIWAANHALVLPSRFEGLPLAIAEAMLCGRPVITTAVAGNTELVTDNFNGFVAEAPTVALWDDAMERAWARRADWPAFGARARTDALNFLPAAPVQDFADSLLRLSAAGAAIRNARPLQPAGSREPGVTPANSNPTP